MDTSQSRRSVRPSPTHRAVVGIAVDAMMGHGRAILRGAMRYANAGRRWLIHEELRAALPDHLPWPICDGAITSTSDARLGRMIRSRTEFLVVCTGNADPDDTPVVCADDSAVGAVAADHLLDCRLERFRFYGCRQEKVSVNRYDGFARRVEARGKSADWLEVEYPERYLWMKRRHWPALAQAVRRLPKPVGIFARDDMAAHDLAAACLEAGIAVPDDVAIVGVNNDELLCESAWPALSSVDIDFSLVGYRAAQLLEKLLSREDLSPQERLVKIAPKGVRKRQSSDLLAVNDELLAEAVRYIRDHACDPCTVNHVLRAVPIARRRLEKQFVANLGRTPHDEIVRVRLEQAQRLLQRPEETLEHISVVCGFSAPGNMTRTFKEVLHTTPGAYRRQYLEKLLPTPTRRK